LVGLVRPLRATSSWKPEGNTATALAELAAKSNKTVAVKVAVNNAAHTLNRNSVLALATRSALPSRPVLAFLKAKPATRTAVAGCTTGSPRPGAQF
jgi:hypothetical protein